MSTRSIIMVTSKEKTVRIYKHCDGYPTGNLPVLASALESLQAGSKSRKNLEKKLEMETVDTLAKLILKEAELEDGCLEEEFQGALKPNMLGGQCDLEWVYVVDTDAKTVNVYGGDPV